MHIGGKIHNKGQGFGYGGGQHSAYVPNIEWNVEGNNDSWVLDSGASHHITNDASNLSKVPTFLGFDGVMIGNGGMCYV